MTGMSRRTRPTRGLAGEEGPRARISGGWHAPCWILVAGCLYQEPFHYAEENQPPVPVSLSPGNQDVVLLDTEVTFLLYAQDPEADEIVFNWFVEGAGADGTAEPVPTGAEADGLYGSQYTLSPDSKYNNRTLFCDIWDHESAHQSVSWDLEVP